MCIRDRRKDISDLDAQRLLRRTHGGALAARPAYEVNVSARAGTNVEGKQAIARACLAEIKDGDAIFIDSGTTMIALAEALSPSPTAFPDGPASRCPVNVNVLTNCLLYTSPRTGCARRSTGRDGTGRSSGR